MSPPAAGHRRTWLDRRAQRAPDTRTTQTANPIRLPTPAAAMAAGIILVAVLTACSGDPTPADDPEPAGSVVTTTTAESHEDQPTSTTEVLSAEEQVEAAYLEAERVYLDVSGSPDPDDERLAATHSGSALARVQEIMSGYLEDGVSVQFMDGRPPSISVESITIDGSSAVIVSCIVDDQVQVRERDDFIIDDQVVTRRYETTMRSEADIWRIDEVRTTDTWMDASGCDR